MVELPFTDVDELTESLGAHAYLADRGLATAIYLSLSLGKPLLLEGEAGVGKTEVAKVLSTLLGRDLIRLQCYEGIDASQALYEWNYSRQLIAVRAMDAAAGRRPCAGSVRDRVPGGTAVAGGHQGGLAGGAPGR